MHSVYAFTAELTDGLRNNGNWAHRLCNGMARIIIHSNGAHCDIVPAIASEIFDLKNFASYILNLWMGTTYLTPLLGAFLFDSYIGRYWTIALGCIASLIGRGLLSLTAIFPQFRPPPCNIPAGNLCRLATGGQNALLYSSFTIMAIGAGGVRPCSVTFEADQFDYTSEKGKRSIENFFSWLSTGAKATRWT